VNIASNPYLFTQIGLDSGMLTMLGSIVHRFNEPGEYRGISLRENVPDAVFYLTVERDRAINQVNIDLATLEQTAAANCCACGKNHGSPSRGHFVLGEQGYAVFHVSAGPGGYAVRVGRAAKEPEQKVFNSTELNDEDLFAATILRPGRYSLRNLVRSDAAPGELHVNYPPVGTTPHRAPAPMRVECTPTGFSPSSLEITATQGCVFAPQIPSRIKIELVVSFDPPRGPDKR
jgi:hypothetical protein